MQRMLGLLAAFVLLAGCGGAPAATSSPTTAPTTAETDDAAADAGATDATDDVADTTADNAATDATGADVASDSADEPLAGAEPAVPEAAPTAAPAPAGPVTLAMGSFNFIDNLHNGTGTASVVQLADGSRVVRLSDDFAVTEGPGLYVWLGTHPEPTNTNDALNGFIDLGGLQARTGAQEYGITADIDLTLYQSVIIWCEPFSQVMTSAALQPQ